MSHAEKVAIINRNDKIERLIQEKIELARQRDEARGECSRLASVLQTICDWNNSDAPDGYVLERIIETANKALSGTK